MSEREKSFLNYICKTYDLKKEGDSIEVSYGLIKLGKVKDEIRHLMLLIEIYEGV
jgi:hypothetical protein